MKNEDKTIKSPGLLKLVFIVLLMVIATPAFADDDLTGFDDDVQDVEEEAPIDGFIYLGIAVSLIIGYKAAEEKTT